MIREVASNPPDPQPAAGGDRRISVRDATAVENPLNASQQPSSTRPNVSSKTVIRTSRRTRRSIQRRGERRRASSVTKALDRLQSSPRSYWNELIVAVLALMGAFVGLHAVGKLSLKALLISQVAFVGMLLFLAGRTRWYKKLLEWSPMLKDAQRLAQTILAFAPAGDIATDALATVSFFMGAVEGTSPFWWFVFSVTVMALSFRGAAVLKYYTARMVPKEEGRFFLWFIPLMFVPGGPYYCRAVSLFSAQVEIMKGTDEAKKRRWRDKEMTERIWNRMSSERREEWERRHPLRKDPHSQIMRSILLALCSELLVMPLSVLAGPFVIFWQCYQAVFEVWHGKVAAASEQPFKDQQLIVLIHMFQFLDGVMEAMPQTGLQVVAFFAGHLSEALFFPSLCLSVFNILKTCFTLWEQRIFIRFVEELNGSGVLAEDTAKLYMQGRESLCLIGLPDLEASAPALAAGISESSSLVKLKICTGDNEAESAVIEIGMTDADFSGKNLGAGGALVVAAFLPKCKAAMKILDISNNDIGVDGAKHIVAAIPAMGAMTSLNMSNNKMLTKDAGKALGDMLKANSVLKELDVSSNYDYDAGATDGAGFATGIADGVRTSGALEKLTISGDDTYSEPVTLETTMTEANFSGKFLQASGAIMLAAFLTECQALVNFDISKNGLYAAGAKAVAEALKGNEIMTELNISSNSMGWKDGRGASDTSGVIAISNAIPTMGALAKLDVSDNMFAAPGFKHLAEALKNNKTLAELNLSSNHATNTLDGTGNTDMGGVTAIANAIPTMGAMAKFTFSGMVGTHEGPPVTVETSMTEADFTNKMLGASGAIMLAAFLPKCQALVKLLMANNKLATKEAGRAVAGALAVNSVLQELDVSGNYWYSNSMDQGDGVGFAKELAVGISANGALASLDLSQNSVPDSEASQIKTACEAKKISLKI